MVEAIGQMHQPCAVAVVPAAVVVVVDPVAAEAHAVVHRQ